MSNAKWFDSASTRMNKKGLCLFFSTTLCIMKWRTKTWRLNRHVRLCSFESMTPGSASLCSSNSSASLKFGKNSLQKICRMNYLVSRTRCSQTLICRMVASWCYLSWLCKSASCSTLLVTILPSHASYTIRSMWSLICSCPYRKLFHISCWSTSHSFGWATSSSTRQLWIICLIIFDLSSSRAPSITSSWTRHSVPSISRRCAGVVVSY